MTQFFKINILHKTNFSKKKFIHDCVDVVHLVGRLFKSGNHSLHFLKR